MKISHDWSGVPLECKADQLVLEAFQVQAAKVFCIAGTVAEDHGSEEHQHSSSKTRDCTGVSQVSEGIQGKLHISLFQLRRSAYWIFLLRSQLYSSTYRSELARQQTEAMLGILVYAHLSSSGVSDILWSNTILLGSHHIAYSHFLTHTMRRNWSPRFHSSFFQSFSLPWRCFENVQCTY